MKKLFSIVLCAILITLLAACGESASVSDKSASSTPKSVNDVLSNALSETSADNDYFANSQNSAAREVSYPQLDYEAEVDLTALSSTMVYSEVFNMMTVPEDYIGKTVKASGTFDVYLDSVASGNYYFACIIADATACCAQGLEFVWDGDHIFPDDYPQVGAPITIGGVFETYEDDGATYCRLKDAQISFEA